jgi:uncharacterized delta-60 repeat protein
MLTLAALVAAPGTLAVFVDPGFNASISGGIVHSIVNQNGSLLVGGEFTTVNGAGVPRIARLNSDGTSDSSFNPAPLDGVVFSVVPVPDDSAYISGNFNTVAGNRSPNLARLSGNGSFDSAPTAIPQGRVTCIAFAPDGALYFGGQFLRVGANSSPYLARLAANGAFDPSFRSSLLSGFALEGGVDFITVQADGRMFVGGTFNTSRGSEQLVRLNADGSLDASFSASGPILYCTAVVPLDDGQILLAGMATPSGDGFVRRLNSDGSIDASFQAPSFNDYVRCLALDPAGRVIVGGSFTQASNQPISHLARLNADGSLDGTWTIGANGMVKAICPQAGGKLVIGGLFSEVGGQMHNGIARLNLEESFRFKSTATGSNGHFSAALPADAGKTYIVEVSTDLKTWTPFSTQTATTSGLEIQDSDAYQTPLRFFRAKATE